jgi:hypothetical protein
VAADRFQVTELKLSEEAIEWRQTDDHIVALDIASTEYFALNGSGAHLWRLLLKGTTLAELSEELVELYGIEKSSADEDVQTFLSQLSERGLLSS